MSTTSTPDRLQRAEPFAEHADQHRPLVSYSALALAFNGLVATGLEVARRRRGLRPGCRGHRAPGRGGLEQSAPVHR